MTGSSALFLPIPVISDVIRNFFSWNCQFWAARPHELPLGSNRMNWENEPLDFPMVAVVAALPPPPPRATTTDLQVAPQNGRRVGLRKRPARTL